MRKIQNPVLAVIDMQNGFLNQYSNHITEKIRALIRECSGRSIPVVFTRFFNFSGSPYETLMGWGWGHGKAETDIVDELAPFVETSIDKNFYSSLTSQFLEMINKNEWKTILLCGIATESCVLKTAVDVFEKGLHPIVISDCCASDRGVEFHQAGLKILPRLIGKEQIMTSQNLLDSLRVMPKGSL